MVLVLCWFDGEERKWWLNFLNFLVLESSGLGLACATSNTALKFQFSPHRNIHIFASDVLLALYTLSMSL